MENSKTSTKQYFQFIIGIILLIPPIISVMMIFLPIDPVTIMRLLLGQDMKMWNGYLGLMAIAGAILISNGNKN